MNTVFEDQLEALTRRFVHRAMNQLRTLEGIVFELENGASAEGLGTQVREIAHSLAGAGGTFGFSKLSACASDLMESEETLFRAPTLIGACRVLVVEIRQISTQRRNSHDGS
jgi:chemotaxis protein histidine kinase CheA